MTKAAVLAALTASALAAETLLPLANPGFEDGLDAWAGNCPFSRALPEAARHGKLGLRIADSSARAGSNLSSQRVPVTPGRAYAVRFAVRSAPNAAPMGVYVQFFDAAGQPLNTEKARNQLIFTTPRTDGKWQDCTFVNRAPQTATAMSVWLHSFNGTTGTVDLDDFSIAELTAEEEKTVRTSPLPTTRRKRMQFPELKAERIAELAAMLPPKAQGTYPPAADRDAWQRFATHPNTPARLARAEKVRDSNPPFMDPEVYLQFTRTGNRTNYQRLVGQRSSRISTLVMAEAIEFRGRFLDAIERDLNAMMDERSWVLPAHDAALENFNRKRCYGDLVSTAEAMRLAHIDWLLGDRLTPQTRRRIREEADRRVIAPYLEVIRTRNVTSGHWWAIGENNWNAVCTANVVRTVLLLVDDVTTRATVLAAMEAANPFFLKGFTTDGYCSEGMGYWCYGFGHYMLMGEAVLRATNGQLSIYDAPIIEAICAYARNIQLDLNTCPAFADCGVNAKPDPSVLRLIQRRFPQTLLARIQPNAGLPSVTTGDIDAFFDDSPYAAKVPEQPSFPPRSLFDQAGIYIGRALDNPAQRLATAIKAGHNGEQHNHNDVGSFTIALNGKQYFLDPGAEIYTRRTFSRDRYVSQMLNSYGHMVPVVAGQLQPAGAQARGTIVSQDFSDSRDTLVIDLRSAYHQVASLKSLRRTLTLDRDALTVTVRDDVEFDSPQTFATALVTTSKLLQPTPDSAIAYDSAGAIRATIATEGANLKTTLGEVQNDHATNPLRLAVELDAPVTKAAITITFTPAPTDQLPGFYREPDLDGLQPDESQAITIQAENFAAQKGGNVSIDDKPGNDGRSFKLWDARGHELSWTFTTTQPATFALQLRLCHAHTLVSRALAVDGKPVPDASTALPLPATGGWSSKADNWRNVWLATPTPDAKPVLLNLQPGTHTLTLTNTDGLGLNLDWLRLVPCRNR